MLSHLLSCSGCVVECLIDNQFDDTQVPSAIIQGPRVGQAVTSLDGCPEGI